MSLLINASKHYNCVVCNSKMTGYKTKDDAPYVYMCENQSCPGCIITVFEIRQGDEEDERYTLTH